MLLPQSTNAIWGNDDKFMGINWAVTINKHLVSTNKVFLFADAFKYLHVELANAGTEDPLGNNILRGDVGHDGQAPD